MATKTGTIKATSRQGSPPTQTLSFTIEDPGPPPVETTFTCDSDYFDDAKHAGGKTVTVTYDAAVTPPVCGGLKVNH